MHFKKLALEDQHMNLHELPFAKIIIHQDDIAEVIVNNEIEITKKIVDEYHRFLLSHLQSPFSLLINKLNSYSYSFEGYQQLQTFKEITAIAVVVYNAVTAESTKLLASYPRDIPLQLEIFSNRDKAFNWLQIQQKQF